MKRVFVMLLCAGLVLAIGAGAALAFPPFKMSFQKRYIDDASADMKAAFEKQSCNTCHMKDDDPNDDDKKPRNAYGVALQALLRKAGGDAKTADRLKTDKDKLLADLEEAFTKTEAMKVGGDDSPTYAELFKSGKLPETR